MVTLATSGEQNEGKGIWFDSLPQDCEGGLYRTLVGLQMPVILKYWNRKSTWLYRASMISNALLSN